MRQRLTPPYISLATTPCGLAPPLGRAEVRINLTFTQTSRLLYNRLFVGPAGVPGTGRETKHLLFRHISPSACKCLGDDQQDGAERRVKPLSFQTWSSPQKHKGNLNFNITTLTSQVLGFNKNFKHDLGVWYSSVHLLSGMSNHLLFDLMTNFHSNPDSLWKAVHFIKNGNITCLSA
ncbi:hypothetical protein ATANTOWER_028365 [Ataeniobius toweri]|uniref:Uncharacterized protein n=1 Tax=Ataeniobius toweri TaxID=208326 RepID=A0ABU7C0W8_9TELE|nr:hypothetical protein [Ataeniobius toweri]